MEIFQCENKFMIFLQRLTLLDIPMTAYAGFNEVFGTNAGLFMGEKLMLKRRYAQLINDVVHLGF